MKLEPQQHDKSPRETYNLAAWPVDWHSKIKQMLALIVYLEEEVDVPPVLVAYSHENMRLTPPDKKWTLWISPTVPPGAPANALYIIQCPLDEPWRHAVTYAASLEEAGQVIQTVITGQIKIRENFLTPWERRLSPNKPDL